MLNATENNEIYTVSQLNQEARGLLEGNFGGLQIEGELSNVAMPASGHWYFTLKDESAQVRCAMFRMANRKVDFRPEEGQQVVLRAKVSLYEGRGDFQLIADNMIEAGDGALRIAFDALKNKLSKEGLFEEKHKQIIPDMPSCVGVITSATGAAVHDVLTVLKRRFPSLPVIIYPSQVQGDTAAKQLVQCIELANQRKECDVLLLTRGGGSLEDLWSFNDEALARAIFNSEIPIVSAVGHEVDFTIADFVADHRAPTPSAAAEFLSPDQSEWSRLFESLAEDLLGLIKYKLENYSRELQHLSKRLAHPGRRLQEQAQRLDTIETRLKNSIHNLLQLRRKQLENITRALDIVSPLATLQRGYSIVTDPNGTVVRCASDVNKGDVLQLKLHEGELRCEVV